MKNLFIIKKNLLHNLKVVKSKTNAKILAVVKANAYGHGILPICKILKDKVDFFGVACLEEALQIRNFDTTSKILVMGNTSNFVLASKHNISVAIYSMNEVITLIKNLKKIKKIRIHIKVDTGMNRLGFSSIPELKKALKLLKKHQNKIEIEGVFTHFATLRNDINFFKGQQERFERFLKSFNDYQNLLIHGGGSLTSLHQNTYNMLRFGIFLYGYGSKHLKPVMCIKAKPISLKKVKQGQNVGYSKSYITENDCLVATLPIGYHDGIPRSFIGEFVYYKKMPLKILSVCMDMTIVEVPHNFKKHQ